ncbi:hypothetical protein H5410_020252 [Solanum commersonii]|uniref:Uncharacterized protein n=1 Tax=Solanum commersonii TaxID=4109 RepID=A0A9J5Z7H3_SOLCO|nr:hypothetical protein H5410_020252 [Solanum commersonii]
MVTGEVREEMGKSFRSFSMLLVWSFVEIRIFDPSAFKLPLQEDCWVSIVFNAALNFLQFRVISQGIMIVC